ncbi:DUF5339 domain-containing protein [Pelistega europaea]|uniref:DUF5339 domain-containing protein n=1 Tax=Pelistega europaea TaxID=106147 RepID=A0A7Y4L8I8_9BURK|nr:DUF5339 domain-containing protein [Pelistega europaea]NOL48909.1 DUF5339 domain-containing protein [Pelistega europaea]
MKKMILVAAFLGLTGSAYAADLAPACQEYFKDYEAFLAKVPAAQADMVKQQYETAKQQMGALPAEQQESACKMAIEQFKQVKAAMGVN